MNYGRIAAQLAIPAALIALLALPGTAFAEVDSTHILDDAAAKFRDATGPWSDRISSLANYTFWALNLISLTWGLGQLVLRRADINDIFGEVFRHILFTGFFYWLFINGTAFSTLIISSFRTAAGAAIGSSAISPSGIVDIGLNIVERVVDAASLMDPLDTLGLIICALIVLCALALIAANLMLMLCAGWVVSSAGTIFLGFGGSRWTSDMAINFYKTSASIGASLFTMTLLVGIGQTIMDDFYRQLSGSPALMEMMALVVVAVVLAFLVDKLPNMMAGIVSGASGGAGIGTMGVGAGMAAGTVAAGLAAGAVGGLAAGAAAAGNQAGGAASAVSEAMKSASDHMANGEGLFTGKATESMGPVGRAALFAADAASTLARAAGQEVKSTLGQRVDSALEGVKESVGGRTAERIAGDREASAEARADATNSMSAGDSGDKPQVASSQLDTSGIAPELQDFVKGGAKNA